MRTLKTNPKLGSCVRTLSWTYFDLFECDEEDWEDPQVARKLEGLKSEFEGSDLSTDMTEKGERYDYENLAYI